MTTMIAAYNSEGCIGRCDAKCYNATEPNCTCICGGKNHGAGHKQALENTQELAEQWMAAYKDQHPDTSHFTIPVRKPTEPVKAKQLTLPI